MIRYNIRVNYGDGDITRKFYFVHENWQNLTNEEQDNAFNDAVTELNRVYKTYGRFATQRGVTNLFNSYGFIETVL